MARKSLKHSYSSYNDQTLLKALEATEYKNPREDPNEKLVFVVGSVQGNYRALLEILNGILSYPKAKGDSVVFLGDIMGQGKDSAACMDLVRKFQLMFSNVTILKGRNEHYFCRGKLDWFKSEPTGIAIRQSFYNKHMLDVEPEDMVDVGIFLNLQSTFVNVGSKLFLTAAGVNTTKELTKQTHSDTLFPNSQTFLNTKKIYDRSVVYGFHSTKDNKVKIQKNYYGLNTNPSVTDKISVGVFDYVTGNLKEILQN